MEKLKVRTNRRYVLKNPWMQLFARVLQLSLKKYDISSILGKTLQMHRLERITQCNVERVDDEILVVVVGAVALGCGQTIAS